MTGYFLWLCGATGAGKKHLAQKLMWKRDGLRERFGLNGNVRFIGSTFDRMEPAVTVEEIAAVTGADCLVIIWQWANAPMVIPVIEAFPNARHRIVVVRRDFDKHVEALRQRSPEREWGLENVEGEWGSVYEWACSMQPHAEVDIVSGDFTDYPAITP